MKPSDLKRTTTFATRRPLVQDGVFYVPTYYKEYGSFQLPPFTELFQTKDPTVYIEYCSGNGDWVVQRAMLYPDKQWVAVEQRFDRAMPLSLIY
jgi:tRNA (guanine-N7-)-methyltransferase